MHFICTLCGIFLHTHVSHIHCLIVLFYLCNFQYIIIRIFVLLLFFFFVDYIIPISQCTYAYMHMHIHNHTELNSQSITELMNIKHRHHPYECSVFCILLMLFLEFSFWLLFVMLVYIFPLVLLLFFWTMWEFQSQMFFCLSLYTYCIHYINMEEMCPYSGSLCMLRSHANFTPFICLISMNSQCFGVPNFHN